MDEKIEKKTEKDTTAKSKSFDILDWLWGPEQKRKVLGLLQSKRNMRTKAHGK